MNKIILILSMLLCVSCETAEDPGPSFKECNSILKKEQAAKEYYQLVNGNSSFSNEEQKIAKEKYIAAQKESVTSKCR